MRGRGERGARVKSNLNPPPLAALHGRAPSSIKQPPECSLNNSSPLVYLSPLAAAQVAGQKLFEVFSLQEKGKEREECVGGGGSKFAGDAAKLFLFIRAFNNKL